MNSRRLITGLFLGFAILFGSASVSSAETRTLKIYYVHTKERAEITFKKNGRYIKSGLQQVNHMMRDWRRNEPTNMDPRLIDLLWEVYRASGSRDYIHVVSAYRSPATNNMLRSRSSGVAKNSQHMLGKAVDFYLPDVNLTKLRNIGLKFQGGGVGFYPKSGSPFVHLDVGNVRHWPGISRKELASIFPDGKTVHIPSDGKPLPGYQQALAMIKQRQNGASAIQVADDTSSKRRGGGLLARIFGGGADEAEDNAEASAVQVAAARPQPTRQQARPQIQPPSPETPAMMLAALPTSALPLPQPSPLRMEAVAQPEPEVAVAAANAAPASTDEVAALLAASNVPLPTRRPDYMPTATEMPAQIAMASAQERAASLPAVALVTPSRRPETTKGADVIANLLAKQPAEAAVAPEPELAAEPMMAFASEIPGSRPEPVRAAEPVSMQMALLDAKAPVRSSPGTARVAPKGSRPSANDQPEPARPNVRPVSAKVPAMMLETASVSQNSKTIGTVAYSTRLAETPRAVYTAGFTQSNEPDDPRRFSGKAVRFMSIAKFQ